MATFTAPHSWLIARMRRTMPLLALFVAGGGDLVASEPSLRDLPPSALFVPTNVWTAHLKFSRQQWDAMEPEEGLPQGGRGFGFGGFRQPTPLAPIFLRDGDQSQDGKLTRPEFRALAEKWFAAWDVAKLGKLNLEQLRAGISSTFSPGTSQKAPPLRRNGVSAMRGIEFKFAHADLEFAGESFHDVAVRYKGNGTYMQSRGSIKRSLKVDLNKYAKGQHLAGVTTLNFHSGVSDGSWMNEVLSHRLYRDAGVPAPRTAYARVYVTVPGLYDKKYFGLYSLVENIDTHFAGEFFGTKKGAIFKPATRALFADLGNDWSNYEQIYDPKTDLSAKEKRRLIDFCRLITEAPEVSFPEKLGDYLDLDEFARFMAVTAWLSTLDSILGNGHNFTVFLDPRSHRFQFMPWDLDQSFGQFGASASPEQRENLSIYKPWRGENTFLERVFKVEAFQKLYVAKLEEFSGTIFQPDRFRRQVDELALAIRPAVKEESDWKLSRFDKLVAGEIVDPSRDPDAGYRFGSGRDPGKPIKGFAAARWEYVKSQLAGKIQGETLENGRGFVGPARFGGGQGGFAPAEFFATSFLSALDANHDGDVSKAEFLAGFDNWFQRWNTNQSGKLTEEQLREGIASDLAPRGRRPPGGF